MYQKLIKSQVVELLSISLAPNQGLAEFCIGWKPKDVGATS
jgi:hypothetical protein